MSLHTRIVVLTTAGLIAAGFTTALLFDPLCSVFSSKRHYAGGIAHRPPAATATATPAATQPPTSLAAHP